MHYSKWNGRKRSQYFLNVEKLSAAILEHESMFSQKNTWKSRALKWKNAFCEHPLTLASPFYNAASCTKHKCYGQTNPSSACFLRKKDWKIVQCHTNHILCEHPLPHLKGLGPADVEHTHCTLFTSREMYTHASWCSHAYRWRLTGNEDIFE